MQELIAAHGKLRPNRLRFRLILSLLLAALFTTAPSWAQNAVPAPKETAKAKSHKPAAKTKKQSAKKAASATKASGSKAGHKKTGKAAKKEPIGAIPKSTRAPALPRVEPVHLNAADRAVFAEAMRAVEARAWPRAQAAIEHTNNPLLHKIVDWTYLREPGGHVTFNERTSFIANNPGWPGLKDMQRRAEDVLADQVTVTVPVVLVGWFNEHPPVSTSGRVAYARALATVGETAKATQVARDAWVSGSFDRGSEREFLDNFAGVLTPDDHRRRLDNLLYDEDTDEAGRMLGRVDDATAATARARIALITGAGNVDSLLRAVPPEFATDPGLLYDRIKWRRKHDQEDDARALLPRVPDTGPRPDLMWKEREFLAHDALDNGLITEAYTIVKNHGELTAATGLGDAEWMAGWISLRFLKDGEAALPHFEKVYDTVQVPANIARGAYWTGRTASFLGREDIAAEWYRKAAAYITTYYGQLALGRLHDDPLPALSDDPIPTPEERDAFEARSVTQAMRALADIGDTQYLRTFIIAAADASGDAVDRVMAAEFASRLGHPDWGVVLARQAARSNVTLLDEGYPIPSYAVPQEPERAFIFAITRQESNFDPNARSAAGAMGLMQLLPSTAKAMAKKAGVKFTATHLITDPAYNARLGAYYLDSMVDNFGGSYLLATAAYNAGPGRVRQWIRQFGDPRDRDVDAVDWVEKIPFFETRAYVQRVMENMMIYRARLGKTRNIGQTLEAELVRPTKAATE